MPERARSVTRKPTRPRKNTSERSKISKPKLPSYAFGTRSIANRSPVFKAMLENEMEESRRGTIKISDVSYDALRAFVNYLCTAEAWLDEQMACDLLVLAEKYQVKHLKGFCEKFLLSKLNWDNSLLTYAFAHQHDAKLVLDAALSLITYNMDKLTKKEEYIELVEKDPRLVVEIYEAYTLNGLILMFLRILRRNHSQLLSRIALFIIWIRVFICHPC
ncbi:BTB/POZ domain-containing protein [Hibiscus syriacus]|uniref:BTB/POZ domain-containing protein n=1 Tax=Hibiscus syriacus TaxID=106335 RepID=A0A6A3D384_HIBSY|nr:BTB/POZ domain-containing protein [Hibiscus syriacus]